MRANNFLEMDENVQSAIETVDSARQHKCELEERRRQLDIAISQVETTAEITRKEIELHFADLQQKITKSIQARASSLLAQVNEIEQNAINPLRDCHTVIDEDINEAAAVVTSGENLLNQDIVSEGCKKQLLKFISMSDSLPLDSLPEVPSVTEVPSISIMFDDTFSQSILTAIKEEGIISKQSPVQIIDLHPRPGGIIIVWGENDSDNIAELKETGHKVLYKLQSCLGKVSKKSIKGKSVKDVNNFRDEYIGPEMNFTVRNLSPNTVYTFRVCRCTFGDNNSQISVKQWTPWSIFQEKVTTIPGFKWAALKDSESFLVSEKCKTASKKSGFGKVIYSAVSDHMIGYPVTFKIENEGKTKNKTDCIAICTKRDTDATGLHTKEGTFCIVADGRVYVNGTLGSTKFNNFSRGLFITFKIDKVEDGDNRKSKPAMPTTYRVTLSVGDREAVFDWHPLKSTSPCTSQNLAFALMFTSSGWKVSFI